jgi:hypothetical protein
MLALCLIFPTMIPDAINISGTTQLFAFLDLIESHNLTQQMNPPVAHDVVIRPDPLSWERGYAIGGFSSVAVDTAGKIRVWYTMRNRTLIHMADKHPPQPDYHATPILTAYAESVDGGRSFVKPILRKYSRNGSLANNIIGTTLETATQTVWIDPTAPATQRYRGINGFNHSTSADGFNWTKAPKAWEVHPGYDDTQNVVFWDPPCQCYSLYTRFKTFVKPFKGPKPTQFRMVRRVRSRSVEGAGEWANQTIVMRADAVDNASHTAWSKSAPPMDYYGATPWIVDLGAQHHLYFMASVRYWHWGPAHEAGGSEAGPGTKDIALSVSRDGSSFDFLGDRLPFAQPTMDGTAGSRTVWLMPGSPVRVADEELYFFTRNNVAEGSDPELLDPHNTDGWESEIVVARARRHGLVSLDAGYTEEARAAQLRTKLLTFSGSRLVLNLDAAGAGALSVEVLGANGKLLATSVPSTANSVRFEVVWAVGSVPLASLQGQPVRLVLRMQACKLYSMSFV